MWLETISSVSRSELPRPLNPGTTRQVTENISKTAAAIASQFQAARLELSGGGVIETIVAFFPGAFSAVPGASAVASRAIEARIRSASPAGARSYKLDDRNAFRNVCWFHSSCAQSGQIFKCSSISRLRTRSSSPSRYPCKSRALSSQTTCALLLPRPQKRFAQPFAASCQARHHGANRYAHQFRNLLVRKPFQFAQHQHLAKSHRQFLQRLAQHAALHVPHNRCFHIRWRRILPVHPLVELFAQRRRPVLLQKRIARIAHNLQQPGTRIPTLKPAKELVRPQASLLHHIFRIMRVPDEPARQIVSRIQMRHHRLLKSSCVWRVSRVWRCHRHPATRTV